MPKSKCEKCGRMTEKRVRVLDRSAYWCGCGNSGLRYNDPRFIAKPKRGRPPTERGAYNHLPGRKFGRVSDADWQEIRDACELSGLSLVAWALPMLLKKARRERLKQNRETD